MYIIICAPPGVGKTIMTREVERFMRGVKGVHIAPHRCSKESLLDTLAESKCKVELETEIREYQSLHVVQGELAVLIPKYDTGFMSVLNRLWDTADKYEEAFRTVGKLSIESPQLTMLLATQPNFLWEISPIPAWEQGFMSRMIIAYDSEMRKPDLFAKVGKSRDIDDWLQQRLRNMHELKGEFFLEEDAMEFVRDWYEKDMPPAPQDGKLYHYKNRRPAHFLKLCQVASVSRSSELVINLQDAERARDWLLDMEATLPELFRNMEAGGDQKILETLWNHCWSYFLRNQKPIPQSYIMRWLNHRVETNRAPWMLEALVNGGYLKRIAKIGEEFTYEPQDVEDTL